MKYVVYWQPNIGGDIECQFFQSEGGARAKVASLIEDCEKEWEGNPEYNCPTMDITLMKVMGEVRYTPNGLRLVEKA